MRATREFRRLLTLQYQAQRLIYIPDLLLRKGEKLAQEDDGMLTSESRKTVATAVSSNQVELNIF